MELFYCQLNLRFKIATGTETINSKWSPYTAVDVKLSFIQSVKNPLMNRQKSFRLRVHIAHGWRLNQDFCNLFCKHVIQLRPNATNKNQIKTNKKQPKKKTIVTSESITLKNEKCRLDIIVFLFMNSIN